MMFPIERFGMAILPSSLKNVKEEVKMKFIHHTSNTFGDCNGLNKVSMAGAATSWGLGSEYGTRGRL